MAKFKVGDRVKCVDVSHTTLSCGNEYEISGTAGVSDEDDPMPLVHIAGRANPYFESRFELAPPKVAAFRVGDVVNCEDASGTDLRRTGEPYIVGRVSDGGAVSLIGHRGELSIPYRPSRFRLYDAKPPSGSTTTTASGPVSLGIPALLAGDFLTFSLGSPRQYAPPILWSDISIKPVKYEPPAIGKSMYGYYVTARATDPREFAQYMADDGSWHKSMRSTQGGTYYPTKEAAEAAVRRHYPPAATAKAEPRPLNVGDVVTCVDADPSVTIGDGTRHLVAGGVYEVTEVTSGMRSPLLGLKSVGATYPLTQGTRWLASRFELRKPSKPELSEQSTGASQLGNQFKERNKRQSAGVFSQFGITPEMLGMSPAPKPPCQVEYIELKNGQVTGRRLKPVQTMFGLKLEEVPPVKKPAPHW